MFPAAIISTIGLFFIALLALRSRHQKRHPLRAPLINSQGIVEQSLIPEGAVLVQGELWLARSFDGSHIPAKTHVIVVGSQNHLLIVS